MLTYRLLLPIGLGIAAAGANYVALERATATHYLVAVRNDVKAGDPLSEKDLYPVAVRGDKALFEGAVAYNDRASVYDVRVRRKVAAGELLLRGDIENAPSQVSTDIPAGFESLTLTARRSAIATRPYTGQHVVLISRKVQGGGQVTQKHGPYLFLGWVAGTEQTGKDSDLVRVVVAVPQQRDPRVEELRAVQAGGSADWLMQVEVVVPPASARK